MLRRWLGQWDVNEDEPSWSEVIVAGVVFVLAMVAICGSIWLIAAAMDLPA